MHFLENVIWVLITISLKCLPKGTVESKSALVLLLAIPHVCVSAYHSFENNFFHLISFRQKWILTEPYPCYKVQDQRVLADHLQHCEYQNISATEVRARQFYRYNSHNAKCGDVWKKDPHISRYSPMRNVLFVAGYSICNVVSSLAGPNNHHWPLLLTWFNFNPSMDK